MKRMMMGLVIAALALPIAVLAAMVGDAEHRIANAQVVRVAIRGYDPRDMLRGHYLVYRFDWNAEITFVGRTERLCVVAAPADAPARVRPLAADGAEASTAGCALVLKGWGEVLPEARRIQLDERRLQFTPAGVASGRLYVPERHARELERLLASGKVQLTIDLAVMETGRASVKAWHIDGKTVDAYFAK